MPRKYAPLYNIADGSAMVIFKNEGDESWEVFTELGGPGSRPEAETLARAMNQYESD